MFVDNVLPDRLPQSQSFVGLHRELCFVAAWPDRKPGYWAIHAKELGMMVHAHRLVVMLLVGPLSRGDMVLHRCGNADCHNPNHMNPAGDAENRRDMLLHAATRGKQGPRSLEYQLSNGKVLMPEPLILSCEPSRLAATFQGFSPGHCYCPDWLHPTYDGYLQLCESTYSGKLVGAHRKVYMLFNGPLNRYEIVSHRCGNKRCLNPYHLVISGLHADRLEFDLKHDRRFRPGVHRHTILRYRTAQQQLPDTP